MSTNSANISALFTSVTTDLVPFYDSAVLLPNQALITNSINIEGGAGDTVQFPTMDSFTVGTTLTQGSDVLATPNDFETTAVSIQAVKRGSGTFVTEEALEDGQFDVVRGAVVSQLSRAAASATDIAGFKVFINNTETAPTDADDLDGADGNILLTNSTVGAAGGAVDLNVVFSNQSMGFMSKRGITASMQEDVQFDRYIMTGTVRNGFKKLRDNHMLAVGSIAGSTATADNASLVDFASAVATLRANNAPADASGFYYAAITPQVEYILSSYINGVNGASNIGSLSDLGNRALLDAVISEAIGIRWLRTNNLVTGVTNTQG
tara:strand:+ start:423 stop:1388 length:966 start_codon:yes stop_codon:yes gene_type:complete